MYKFRIERSGWFSGTLRIVFERKHLVHNIRHAKKMGDPEVTYLMKTLLRNLESQNEG